MHTNFVNLWITFISVSNAVTFLRWVISNKTSSHDKDESGAIKCNRKSYSWRTERSCYPLQKWSDFWALYEQ